MPPDSRAGIIVWMRGVCFLFAVVFFSFAVVLTFGVAEVGEDFLFVSVVFVTEIRVIIQST